MTGFIETLVARTLVPSPVLPGAVRPQVRGRFEPEPGALHAGPSEDEPDGTWPGPPPRRAADAPSPHPPAMEHDTAEGLAARVQPAHGVPAGQATPPHGPPDAPRQPAGLAPMQPGPEDHAYGAHGTSNGDLPARPVQPHAPSAARQPARPAAPRRDLPPSGRATTPVRAAALPEGERTAPPARPAAAAITPRPLPAALSATLPAPVSAAAPAWAPAPASAPDPESVATIGVFRPAPALLQAAELPLPAALFRQPMSRPPMSRHDHRPQVTPPAAAPVHVSIGRIEIRAVAPARAPAARTNAAPQPVALDEYLRQRTQGGKP